MRISGSEKIPIERVDGPGRAWLELKGTILLYHKQSWVASSSTFIPVEWIHISEERRRDVRRLWRGLIGLLVAVLFALPLSLLLFRMNPHLSYDLPLGMVLAAFLLFSLVLGAGSLLSFFFPRPSVVFDVESNPFGLTIRFWRAAKQDQPVADLLERIRAAQQRRADAGLHPIRVNHLWRRPLPYRIALIQGLAISFCLAVIMFFMESLRFSGYPVPFSRLYYGFLAVPPVVLLLSVALRRAGTLWEPRNFRKALRCYARSRLPEAVSHLLSLLEEYPDHHLGRLLMVRTLTEQFAFSDALKHCECLAREHPVLAARLQASIWDVKRMESRMCE